MFNRMDASCYENSISFRNEEFENILKGIIACYNLMNLSKSALPNDENKIRDIMLKEYLKKKDFKEKYYNLNEYQFDKEIEDNDGRVDIRVLPVKDNYIEDAAYFVIECKRLDSQNLQGSSGLNAKYIKNGVCRFVSSAYSSYFGVNGMIAFVVEKIDISKNVDQINLMLDDTYVNDRGEMVNAEKVQGLTHFKLKDDFEYSYISVHKVNNNKNITLYHLMLNFSNRVAS